MKPKFPSELTYTRKMENMFVIVRNLNGIYNFFDEFESEVCVKLPYNFCAAIL